MQRSARRVHTSCSQHAAADIARGGTQVLGQSKGVLSAVMSVACFHNVVPAAGWFGYGITVFGCTLYGRCKARARQAREQWLKRHGSQPGLMVDMGGATDSLSVLPEPTYRVRKLDEDAGRPSQPSVSGSMQHASVAHTRSGVGGRETPQLEDVTPRHVAANTRDPWADERHLRGAGFRTPPDEAAAQREAWPQSGTQRVLPGAERLKHKSGAESDVSGRSAIPSGSTGRGDGSPGSVPRSPREDASSASSDALHVHEARAQAAGRDTVVRVPR